jgi:Protein of unknown function (DUF4043)
MAVGTYGINDAATVKTWSKVTAMEAEKQLDIKPLMGTGPNSIIQVKNELTKSAGDRVRYLLTTQLKGTGVSENEKMEGNEEALSTYSDDIIINELNHSVRIKAEGTIEDQRVLFNAREAAYKGLGLHVINHRIRRLDLYHVFGVQWQQHHHHT